MIPCRSRLIRSDGDSVVFNTYSDLQIVVTPDSQLPSGRYRLTLSDDLVDLFGNPIDGDGDGIAGGDYSTEYWVSASVMDRLVVEGFGNSSITNATPLGFEPASDQDPWQRSQLGFGTFEKQDLDWWTFNASAQDFIQIFVDGVSRFDEGDTRVALYHESDLTTNLLIRSGQFPLTINTQLDQPGDYYFSVSRVSRSEVLRAYALQINRGTDIPFGGDASMGGPSASPLEFVSGLTKKTARIAGTLVTPNTGAFFRLGQLEAGNTVTLDASTLPTWSPLEPIVEIIKRRSSIGISPDSPGTDPSIVEVTIPEDGVYYARVHHATQSIDRVWDAQYLLEVQVGNFIPVVVRSDLPVGQSNHVPPSSITFTLSQEVDPLSISRSFVRLYRNDVSMELPDTASVRPDSSNTKFTVLGLETLMQDGQYRLEFDMNQVIGKNGIYGNQIMTIPGATWIVDTDIRSMGIQVDPMDETQAKYSIVIDPNNFDAKLTTAVLYAASGNDAMQRVASLNTFSDTSLTFEGQPGEQYRFFVAGIDAEGSRVHLTISGDDPTPVLIDSASIFRFPDRMILTNKPNIRWVGDWEVGMREFIDGILYVPLRAPGSHSSINVRTNNLLHNFVLPPDVNRDGQVTALDALQILNQLALAESSLQDRTTPVYLNWSHYLDVSGDGQISALDALQVINAMAREQRQTVEFEQTSLPLTSSLQNDGMGNMRHQRPVALTRDPNLGVVTKSNAQLSVDTETSLDDTKSSLAMAQDAYFESLGSLPDDKEKDAGKLALLSLFE